MSPDIEWHVGEDAERETIAAASSPRRSRRSWIAVLIVVMLGAGLGMAYRSIPEPAPRPTPTPSPTPRPTPTHPAVPARLFASLDREARALADGDVMSYSVLQMPREGQMADQPRDDNFQAWGRPVDDRPLFTIIDTNLSTMSKAWAEIRQFRHGRWFRATRFYQFDSKEGRWLRADPDPSFWSGQVATLDTPHFHAIYFVEDRDLVQPVLDQLEKARTSICADLGCGTAPPTYTLKFNSGVTNGWPLSDDGRTIFFTSPRVMGVYEDATPLGEEGQNLIWALAWTTVQRVAYGEIPVDLGNRTNNSLLWAIGDWATSRAAEPFDSDWLPRVKTEVQKQPLPLEALWSGSVENTDQAIYRLAFAVTYFIEQEYGAPAVAKVLKSIRAAQSFSDVIETALGVPFAEFDQKWQAWVKTNLAAP